LEFDDAQKSNEKGNSSLYHLLSVSPWSQPLKVGQYVVLLRDPLFCGCTFGVWEQDKAT